MAFKGRRRVGMKSKKTTGVRSHKSAVKKAIRQVKMKQFARMVKKVVHKEQETKLVSNLTVCDLTNIPGAGVSTAGNGVISSITPLVVQGTAQNHRIGNKIRPVKLSLRYAIYGLPTTVAGGTNPFRGLPFLVKVVVYRHRYNKGDSSPDAILDGGGTNYPLANVTDAYFRPFNRGEYEIAYSATHKMEAARHLDATYGLIEPNSLGSSNYTSFIIRKCNIKVPKQILFNDNGSTPSNLNWWVAFSVCNIDSSAITSAQVRASVNAESFLFFQDD